MNNSSAEVNIQLNMKLNTNSLYIILYMSTHILWWCDVPTHMAVSGVSYINE